ncbi:heparan-alpha-glucosaminide N-acetyltransferase domain-containing protein [Curvibacter sp. HBC61]|uniref:Heparan-alpha-glucosaminide N-acetyltransferase domain-containing protein n=1 Tax=Curvibacter cyanobacteriorum TaxID=3026422 RepID=A0ABT5N4U2_9BURK|nr:heparan-alpha-glucosaminide N-acetyltransferase domain-containing protein [Curvibacter sp. HBC61]MDD0841112.1 heparan-alpha-glucosaminide N-acetyltransferase domain-containing protein [Curvibacter sp. HBC61]
MPPDVTRVRLSSIDRLRGAVMALMLVDHVREYFFLHQQVSDPMVLNSTSVELFFTRLSSHFCAPVFVLLTGLGAWLYGQKNGRTRRDTAVFLAQRGLILIALELTVVNFAWSLSLSPPKLYLQVIWAIGLSMLALSALLWLPRPVQAALAVLIMAGHNLLDPLQFTPQEAGFIPWAILHDRSLIELSPSLTLRTSYPVLPWIGIMLAGYLMGPLYRPGVAAAWRQRWLVWGGVGALLTFAVLRLVNRYGDHPWVAGATLLESVRSFLNLTKYPPSLQFILLTLGLGWLALAGLERLKAGAWLDRIGAVPLFFYLGHLYLLQALYQWMAWVFGTHHAGRFGLDAVWQVWALAAGVLWLMAGPCRALAQLKQRSQARWLSYF